VAIQGPGGVAETGKLVSKAWEESLTPVFASDYNSRSYDIANSRPGGLSRAA